MVLTVSQRHLLLILIKLKYVWTEAEANESLLLAGVTCPTFDPFSETSHFRQIDDTQPGVASLPSEQGCARMPGNGVLFDWDAAAIPGI